MNDNYLIEKWLVTLLMLVIAIAFYLIGKRLTFKQKYSGQVNIYLIIIIASICSLLFFYPIAIIDDQLGIGNKYLTGMAIIFIPISFLLLIVSITLFFIKKKVNLENKKNYPLTKTKRQPSADGLARRLAETLAATL